MEEKAAKFVVHPIERITIVDSEAYILQWEYVAFPQWLSWFFTTTRTQTLTTYHVDQKQDSTLYCSTETFNGLFTYVVNFVLTPGLIYRGFLATATDLMRICEEL